MTLMSHFFVLRKRTDLTCLLAQSPP